MDLKKKLIDLLEQWQAGEVIVEEVHAEAERLWSQNDNWPIYPENHPDSVTVEVLSQLDMLNHQWITVDDIPVLLRFLRAKPGTENQAWAMWREYWDGLDLEARKEALKDQPYYLT